MDEVLSLVGFGPLQWVQLQNWVVAIKLVRNSMDCDPSLGK